MPWEREIEGCRNVARRAGELALAYAARGVTPEDKADNSPVTAADRECERLIVRELRAAFPDDGFVGEEGASDAGSSGRRWIVDPIDGTRDFVRGLPTWSNLIGLEAILVPSGRAEAWIELAAKPWDLAPFKVIAEEAGARFFNFDGGSSIRGGNAVICAPFLEQELRALVRPAA